MMARVVRRVLAGVATILLIYVVTFVMAFSIPGNPFQQGDRAMPAEVESALRVRYGLDDNWTYFWRFLGGAIRLDFGPTFSYVDWTCNQVIESALPVSISLGLLAILIALLVGVPIGVVSAVRKNSLFDHACTTLVLLGISLPTFVSGAALLTVFSVVWSIAPVGGWGTPAHMILPALTLSLPFIAYVARLTRMSMLDVLGSDFIRTALAKGVPRQAVIWRHALPVAILPVVSYVGPALAQAMTGSFVVEKVFGVPGLGQHFVNAALNRDVGLIMSCVLVFSTLLVAMNIVIDFVYVWFDPRISRAV
jgi:oligopeptide transport system permease protein